MTAPDAPQPTVRDLINGGLAALDEARTVLSAAAGTPPVEVEG